MRVLVDTSALLALANPRDQWHARAARTAHASDATGVRYVGTLLVLAEFHAHLMYLRGAGDARRGLAALLDSQAHEWLPVDAALIAEAITRWIMRFADQRFSLTHAVSFEIMRRERIKQAFAFDRQFEAAGFSLIE